MATINGELRVWVGSGKRSQSHDTQIFLRQPSGPDPGEAAFEGPGINGEARITITGTSGEPIGGIEFGLVQLQFVETNWWHYRGQTVADGSVFDPRDRRPARASQLCRDQITAPGPGHADPSRPWYGGGPGWALTTPSGLTLPSSRSHTFSLKHVDFPSEAGDLIVKNSAPSFSSPRLNFLYSAQCEFAFLILLIAKPPGRAAQFLRHCYWNMRCRAHFAHDSTGRFRVNESHGMRVSVQSGPLPSGFPTRDGRFRESDALDMTLPVCNTVANLARSNLSRFRPSPVWAAPDVRHPIR